jgi:phosphinothricin acetyltransferase
LEHAIRVAPEFGFSVLIAILLSKNPASIGLLEKHGFSCWGAMPGIAKIGDQTADHLYYGLKLA